MNTISLDDELALLHERICPALDHPVRMKIIYLLNEKAMNVGELTEVMGIPQSSVSRHLRVLRERGLVRTERQGTTIWYGLTHPELSTVITILRGILGEQLETQIKQAKTILKTMSEEA
ncbi:MAG: metalloregulator ArsR/SmtB family transcription factor [Anaerolineaceae bacterium]|nr:metalloregulator ArsR/SmtB family transcription factor [Anaerolineaceae bacterium]